MIRAVLFDLDRTLVDRDTSIRTFFRAQADLCREGAGEQFSTDAFTVRLLELDNHGYSDKAQTYATVVKEFSLPAEMARTLERDFRDCFAGTVVLFRDTLSLLNRLHAHPYKLGLITNGTEAVQCAKLRATGLEGLFDAILISEIEGMKKPKREIFERALARLNVAASDAVFVGDNLDVDVRGAKRAGLRAVWLADPNDAPSVDADAIITNLNELEAALDGLNAVVAQPIQQA